MQSFLASLNPIRCRSLGSLAIGAFVVALGGAHAAFAQTLTFTDQASFLADVQSGDYLETFDSLPLGSTPNPTDFSHNGFAYSAASAGDLFDIQPDPTNTPSDVALSTNDEFAPLVLTFTSGNVTAVGGQFFQTVISGDFVAGDITATLDNGTSITVDGGTLDNYSFAGFVTSLPISSLTLSVPTNWSTVDNLIVGSAAPGVSFTAPEPGSMALVLGPVFGLAAGARLRRRRRHI